MGLLPSRSFVLSWLSPETAFSTIDTDGVWTEFETAGSREVGKHQNWKLQHPKGNIHEMQMTHSSSLPMDFQPNNRSGFGSFSFVKGWRCCWGSDGQHYASWSSGISGVSLSFLAVSFTPLVWEGKMLKLDGLLQTEWNSLFVEWGFFKTVVIAECLSCQLLCCRKGYRNDAPVFSFSFLLVLKSLT